MFLLIFFSVKNVHEVIRGVTILFKKLGYVISKVAALALQVFLLFFGHVLHTSRQGGREKQMAGESLILLLILIVEIKYSFI